MEWFFFFLEQNHRLPKYSGCAETARGRGFPSPTQGTGPGDSHHDATLRINSASPGCTLSQTPSLCLFSIWQTEQLCWSHSRRSTTIFHHIPLGNWKRKNAGRRYSPMLSSYYSDKAGPRQVEPRAGRWSLPAHACSLLYIRYNKAKAWIQKGLPLHWAGMRLEGCSELEKLKELHWIWGRTAGLFYEDSTGAQQLAHCFVWLHMWVFVAVVFCWFLLCCCFSFWFSFSFLLSHLNAHCQHLDEVGWWRGIWLSCWRCTGGKQDKKTTNKQKQQNREVRINIRMEQQIAITSQHSTGSICCISRSCWLGLTRNFQSHCVEQHTGIACCKDAGQVSAHGLMIYPSSL